MSGSCEIVFGILKLRIGIIEPCRWQNWIQIEHKNKSLKLTSGKGFLYLTSEQRSKKAQNFARVPEVTIFCSSLLSDNAVWSFEFHYCRMQALSTEFESSSATHGFKYRCFCGSDVCWCTNEMQTFTAVR